MMSKTINFSIPIWLNILLTDSCKRLGLKITPDTGIQLTIIF
jgi:hypothetical protein